jgi:hypothetical protein
VSYEFLEPWFWIGTITGVLSLVLLWVMICIYLRGEH